jgi:hypothetical protein
MPDVTLALSAEERQFLTGLLQTVLKDTRIEEHRTRTLSYREHVLHKEELIKSVLSKLGEPAG